METLARDLREALASGAFAHHGRVELSDGMTVDPERMARIVLADFERINRDGHDSGSTASEQLTLYDDMLRLLTLRRVHV
jgi:hypothetical protein